MTKSAETSSNPSARNAKRILIAVGIVIVLVVGVLFVHPATSLQMQYPFYLLKCGKQPVAANGYSRSYFLPSDAGYSVGFFTDGLYCSEEEAQQAGYKSSWQ